MQYLIRKRNILVLSPVFVLCAAILLISKPASVQSQKSADVDGVGDTITYLPLVLNRFDSTLGIPIFGTQMYGNTSDTSTFHDALLGTNASWLRVEISWASAEPVKEMPPVYQWGSIDNNLAAAQDDLGALNIIATVNRAPSWAAQYTTGPINPGNLEDFANFTRALVERYDGDGIDDAPGSPVILYWEFYNEPDSNSIIDSSFLPPIGWGNHGEEYAIMLEEVYPGIKIANPNAKVVFGGIAYDWFKSNGGKFVDSFLTDVLDAGGGNFFDVMNFHAYPAFYPNWTTNQGPGLFEKAAVIRGVLADYGLEDPPLIVTEAGWHSNNASGPIIPGSPQIQARYVVELFTQSMAADLDVMIWWMLYDVGGNYPYENGLVTNASDPVEKLAYDVYQNVVAELETAHYVRKLTNTETGNNLMEVYLFTDNVLGRFVYVAWLNRVDTTSLATLRLPVSNATVRNSITNSVTAVVDGSDGINDGFITVTVGANPLFIEVDN